MAAPPSISVIVPTFQRPGLLQGCLAGLRRQTLPPDAYEVVVVDDGSGPETAQVLEAAAKDWPHLRWESLAQNRGPAAARNRAIDLSTGEWLVFMDDDIVAPPGLIASHLDLHADGDRWLGILGRVAWHPDIRISRFMRWLDSVDLQFAFERMEEGPAEPARDYFYTCNLSLSRQSVLEVGGFNESFPFPAHEDTELALRLCARGFRLEYRPSALAWNARPISFKAYCRRMEMVGESSVILSTLSDPHELPVPEEVSLPRRLEHLVWGPLSWILPLMRIRARYYRSKLLAVHTRAIRKARKRSRAGDSARPAGSG